MALCAESYFQYPNAGLHRLKCYMLHQVIVFKFIIFSLLNIYYHMLIYPIPYSSLSLQPTPSAFAEQNNPNNIEVMLRKCWTFKCHSHSFYNLNPIKTMSLIKHEISLPLFQPDDIIQVVPFYNTWRDGGFRMEEQNINEKQVFHNYGQGLAQFSLAYGSAYVIGKMVSIKKKSFRTKSCAVIGSGINALMTTLELLKRGLKVTLYTSKLPVKIQKGKKIIESSEGLQFWYCGDYDNDNPVQHELVSKLSLDFLKECLSTNRYQSLSWSNVYVSGPKVDELRENVTQFLTKQVEVTNVNFGNEKLEEYTYFRTIQIDTELFTEEVFTEIRLRNTNVVVKQFHSLNEILSLQQQMIFNCLGSQNKTFFGDKAVSSIPSFYINLKKKTMPKVNFSIWKSSQTEQQDGFVISVSKKKMQITSRNRFLQPQEIQEQKQKQKLFTKAYHFVKEHTTQPSKL